MKSHRYLLLIVSFALFGAPNAQAQDSLAMHAEHAAAPEHIAVQADAVQWAPAPPVLPAGAEIAVLEGDPAKEGPFTLRLKLPNDYHVPAHFHPVIEHVTVISGEFHVGMGDVMDHAQGTELTEGGFAVMQAGVHHYAWTTDETVIQLHSIGPWGLTYVNPADDPRGAPAGQ